MPIETLADRYRAVRARSEALCEPLSVEDCGVQPMDEASPPKWHLAHTAWFFETFLLKPFAAAYQPVDVRYEQLFNSYYNGVGEPYPRPRRGLLSRPTVSDVMDYRTLVDRAMEPLLDRHDGEVRRRVELGLQHEQQHQELMLTDLKANLGLNPLKPAYRLDLAAEARAGDGAAPLGFSAHEGGMIRIGAEGGGFRFDNELPRHRVWLEPFALANRLVTNGEYLEFIEDGGYRNPAWWLSDGWAAVCAQRWR
ncbi:MAG: DinB family protein, partial [Gammaproteobacteria bacterium]|nr:DinB family protein [Gammaproteobacteria bacterium]